MTLQKIRLLFILCFEFPVYLSLHGTSLYSSIFDGSILNYYDNTMQINMPADKNSTYRYLGNRANLMALWDVQDRLRHPNDLNMPFGFKRKRLSKMGKINGFIQRIQFNILALT